MPRGRISFLMYHQVGRFEPMRTHRANYCDHRQFAAQMALLARLRYTVLDLDTALACLAGNAPTPARAVVLTFDDAYDNFIEHALPVLERYRYPATVYAITGYCGQRATWFSKDPGRHQPLLMTSEQLAAARATGITIGSHTVLHRKLAELPEAEQRSELADSKASLEDLLGEPVAHLCYPFGSFEHTTVEIAAELGYRSAVTCLRSAATHADHPLALPRKAISFGDNLLGFWWKVAVKHAPKPALVRWRAELGGLG